MKAREVSVLLDLRELPCVTERHSRLVVFVERLNDFANGRRERAWEVQRRVLLLCFVEELVEVVPVGGA